MTEARRYDGGSDAEAWNAFVEASKNGTFLLDRRYMDYHADRFSDHSLMVYHKERLLALFPANVEGTTVWSHQGLTYGGLVVDCRATAEVVQEALTAINAYYRGQGFERVVYKAVPWIFHRYPAEEALYGLTSVCGARLSKRDIATVIPLGERIPFNVDRRRGVRKGLRAGLTVEESDDTDTFWVILDGNLSAHHHTHPVHTAAELRLLKDRLPEHIRLFMAFEGDTPVAGVLLYITPQVVHTQYISATDRGKRIGAVDLMVSHLLEWASGKAPWFSLGTSVLGPDSRLNTSLIFQKEGFGGRAVCYDTYEWTL